LGRRAIRALSPGEPILAGMVELPPLVRRGDIVLLTAEGRGLRAMTQGEAREEGKMGQVVRVQNLASGREVYGQVAAERIVRVPF
jgi:flagella basal body P-ring formation protein FlgA